MPTTLGWRDEAIMMEVILIRQVLMWKTEQEWTWSKKWFAATPKLLCFPKTGEGADEDKAQTQIGLKFSTSNFCMGFCLMAIILLSFGSTVGPKASRVNQSSRWWLPLKERAASSFGSKRGWAFQAWEYLRGPTLLSVGPHCNTLQQRSYCCSSHIAATWLLQVLSSALTPVKPGFSSSQLIFLCSTSLYWKSHIYSVSRKM